MRKLLIGFLLVIFALSSAACASPDNGNRGNDSMTDYELKNADGKTGSQFFC